MNDPLQLESTPTLIDELIAEYAIPDKTFDVPLSKGHSLTFRAITNPGEFAAITQKAKESVKAFWDSSGKPVPGVWADLRPVDHAAAMHCYVLFATCVGVKKTVKDESGEDQEVAWPALTQRDWLVLCKEAHPVFIHIRAVWNEFQSNRLVWDQVEEMQRQGEDLSGNLG